MAHVDSVSRLHTRKRVRVVLERQLRDHLRLDQVGEGQPSGGGYQGLANPSLSEIEGGEGRHTSLNIALRFSSSRNVAICGSMLCWGAISNCNPGDMRSECAARRDVAKNSDGS